MYELQQRVKPISGVDLPVLRAAKAFGGLHSIGKWVAKAVERQEKIAALFRPHFPREESAPWRS